MDKILDGSIITRYFNSKHQSADVLTKALSWVLVVDNSAYSTNKTLLSPAYFLSCHRLHLFRPLQGKLPYLINYGFLRGKERKKAMGDVPYSWRLPEGCTAHIISLTSPKYASILSTVSKSFKAAAYSDTVWERFLPPDHKDILARSDDAPLVYSSKKELYFHLCDSPLLLDGAQLSFKLSKPSGNKSYMLGARKLYIMDGHWSDYWEWKTIADSRFPEVAQLLSGSYIEISGKTQTQMLSSNTKYAAYLVFRYHTSPYLVSIIAYVELAGKPERCSRTWVDRYAQIRSDEWMELELGEFFVNGGDGDDDIYMYFELNHAPCWTISGHIIQGIELRPKV